jgi:hypothetical protein
MILNIGDKKTKLLLSLAKTPLLFYPHYKYHLPLPSVLMIENTNHCNAECVMCPRDTLSRKPGFMDFGLFEKIIKEVSSVRRKPVTHLHGFGEPLLDKLLAERIQLAKACGIDRTYIVTNASLLFPEISRKIISAGLDKMKISFYGTDEESYNITMEAGEPTTPWGRRSCLPVISLGRPCQCSGMAGSLPVVWIPMVFRFWEISTPRVFRKYGMDRCYPGLETALESSTTVSIQSVSPAIGYVDVRTALD